MKSLPPPISTPSAPSASTRQRVFAGVGLALTAVGLAAPLAVPQPPEVVQCQTEEFVRVETPSVLGMLFGQEKPSAVLACAHASSPAELTDPSLRADFAWEGLVREMGGGRPDRLQEEAGGGKATAWPYGQAMAAALDRHDYTAFDKMVQGLERYRADGGGYGPEVGGRGDRYFDDNAWLGLDFVQANGQKPNAEYLHKAQEVFRFLETGIQPDGGILWKENSERPSYNTCAQGPTIELAVRLYQATGDQHYLDVAQKMDRFTDQHLRLENGLYADNIDTGLKGRDDSLFSYNQGTPVGAKMLLYRATGEEHYKTEALETTRAALDHYGKDDNLWKSAPAFNAVMFRNLMQSGVPEVQTMLQGYLDRAWDQALSQDGLFSQHAGLGSYSGKELQMIDQAGLVQLYALQSWPAAELPGVS